MEQRPLILFGNFTENETHQYFSNESVKSCGIEFPEDFLPFEQLIYKASSNVVFDSSSEVKGKAAVPEGSEELGIDGEAENSKETGPKDEKVIKTSEGLQGEVLSSETNQVSDNVESEVDDDSTKYPPSNNISEQEEKIASQTLDQEDASLLENGQAVPEEKVDSHWADDDQATNVVTMGTDTIMTNTTTVGSGHHGPETKKTLWADLFKTKPSSKPQEPLHPIMQSPKEPDGVAAEDSNEDQFRHYFIDVLKKTELTNQIPHLQPRGLKNNANWCYINATLQVLIYCPSFYHFLTRFKLKTDRGKSCTPILDALVLFAGQFSKMPLRQGNKDSGKQDVVMGMPFEPTYVYDLLTQVKTTLSQQGKQEDAEEFLSCILNGLHEELVHLESPGDKQEPEGSTNHVITPNKPERNEESTGEWEEVGRRNRSTVTRKSMMSKTPVAKMFGGYLRSSLVQPGVKETASIQPFYSLQLDLRGDVTTVQQAFDHFFSVEEVEGFQCDKSKVEVEVSKKWTLDSLPVVLILHLKRFVVNKNGCEKLTKKVSYESELQIPPDTLSKSFRIRNRSMLTYKLFAVTYHHGKNLHGGHYTSDIFHPAIGWLRADDMAIRLVPAKFVFNPLSNRDPYLLYYRRGDIAV